MIRTSLAASALLLGLSQVQAAPVDATASYVLTLGGINVAVMHIDLDDNGSDYNLGLKANVAGLGAVVASGTANVTAKGSSSGSTLRSESFALETRASGQTFKVEVGFAGQNVSSFKVDPPVSDYDRVPLERSHLTGVADFVSSFVLKGRALAKNLCDRRMRVFTGVDGQPKRSGWEADAFSTVGAYNVVVDHCTFLWALDENMSASGPRFAGKDVTS